jgi:hypothetical protein
MNDRFADRLTAFQTASDTLFSDRWRPVWQGKSPLIFTERAEQMRTALAALEDFCRRQGVVITGAAEDKQREEAELEDAAFINAKTLVEFYKAQGNLTEAARFDFPITRWRQLRDSELLSEAKSVLLAIRAIAENPDTAAEAANYQLTAEAADALEKEHADYDRLATAPAQGISTRKAMTSQLRAEFANLSAAFETLDNLILRFSGTAEGRDLIATYEAARIIRDTGSRSRDEAPPATPAP